MSTATLRQARAMGGVGSIFVLLSFVPYVGFIFGLAGLVMVLLAVKRISEAVNDKEIFKNVLMAVILQIVGSAISAFVVIGAFSRLSAARSEWPHSGHPLTVLEAQAILVQASP
jgi:uncharacterized membrane protein